jgi:hypothetical protein
MEDAAEDIFKDVVELIKSGERYDVQDLVNDAADGLNCSDEVENICLRGQWDEVKNAESHCAAAQWAVCMEANALINGSIDFSEIERIESLWDEYTSTEGEAIERKEWIDEQAEDDLTLLGIELSTEELAEYEKAILENEDGEEEQPLPQAHGHAMRI